MATKETSVCRNADGETKLMSEYDRLGHALVCKGFTSADENDGSGSGGDEFSQQRLNPRAWDLALVQKWRADALWTGIVASGCWVEFNDHGARKISGEVAL
jgi:hypothetical protein